MLLFPPKEGDFAQALLISFDGGQGDYLLVDSAGVGGCGRDRFALRVWDRSPGEQGHKWFVFFFFLFFPIFFQRIIYGKEENSLTSLITSVFIKD